MIKPSRTKTQTRCCSGTYLQTHQIDIASESQRYIIARFSSGLRTSSRASGRSRNQRAVPNQRTFKTAIGTSAKYQSGRLNKTCLKNWTLHTSTKIWAEAASNQARVQTP